MAILLTGSTGYIGAHIASNLLAQHSDPLNLLVRARDEQEARERLWRSLQLHMDFATFELYLNSRIRIFRGDLTDPPAGYRTPSPEQPYGIGPDKKQAKVKKAGDGTEVEVPNRPK